MTPITQKDYSVQDLAPEQARIEFRAKIAEAQNNPTHVFTRREIARLRQLMKRAGVSADFALLLRAGLE